MFNLSGGLHFLWTETGDYNDVLFYCTGYNDIVKATLENPKKYKLNTISGRSTIKSF